MGGGMSGRQVFPVTGKHLVTFCLVTKSWEHWSVDHLEVVLRYVAANSMSEWHQKAQLVLMICTRYNHYKLIMSLGNLPAYLNRYQQRKACLLAYSIPDTLLSYSTANWKGDNPNMIFLIMLLYLCPFLKINSLPKIKTLSSSFTCCFNPSFFYCGAQKDMLMTVTIHFECMEKKSNKSEWWLKQTFFLTSSFVKESHTGLT